MFAKRTRIKEGVMIVRRRNRINEVGLAAWAFPRGAELALVAEAALDQAKRPDLRVDVLSTTDDTITVEVVEGVAAEPDELMYVECHGVYEIARREVSAPGRSGSGVTRVRLTLVAWPRG
jgi:hypothetical protein